MRGHEPDLLLRTPPESGAVAWRDLTPLLTAAWQAWVPLALLSLGAALLWRLAPNAGPPGMFTLLAALGPLYWLAGWSLLRGLQQVNRRQHLHVAVQAHEGQQRLRLLLTLVGAALALALAPAGGLLGYTPDAVLQNVTTADAALTTVRLGPLLLIALLVGGTMTLLLSVATGLAAAQLPGRAGPLVWLAAGLFLSVGALSGAAPVLPAAFPPTLGQLTLAALERLGDPQALYEYSRALVSAAVLPALLAGAGALLALTATLQLTRARRPVVIDSPLALAAWAAILAVGIRAAGQQWRYSVDATYRYPGDWQDLFVLAVATVWLVQLVLGQGRASAQAPSRVRRAGRAPFTREGWQRLGWAVAVLLSAVVATLPNIRADQVDHADVLLHAALWLAPLVVGMRLVDTASRLLTSEAAGIGGAARQFAGLALVGALALLLVPLDGSGAGLLTRALTAEYIDAVPELTWLGMALLLFVAVAEFTVGRTARSRVRR